jgi:hypothetical protein
LPPGFAIFLQGLGIEIGQKVRRGFGPTPVIAVTVTIDGVTHHGMYYVRGSIMFVQSQQGAKRALVGASPPLEKAKLLLSELVRERPDVR